MANSIGAGDQNAEPTAAPIAVVPLLSAAAVVIAACLRIKNIGMSEWLCLLMLIPIANIFIGYWCCVLPPGYWNSKKLDTWSIVIIALLIAPILFTILALLLPIMHKGR